MTRSGGTVLYKSKYGIYDIYITFLSLSLSLSLVSTIPTK